MTFPFPDAKRLGDIWRGIGQMTPSGFVINGKTYVTPLDEEEKVELCEWFKDAGMSIKVGIPIVRIGGRCYVPPLTREKAREIMECCTL